LVKNVNRKSIKARIFIVETREYLSEMRENLSEHDKFSFFFVKPMCDKNVPSCANGTLNLDYNLSKTGRVSFLHYKERIFLSVCKFSNQEVFFTGEE